MQTSKELFGKHGVFLFGKIDVKTRGNLAGNGKHLQQLVIYHLKCPWDAKSSNLGGGKAPHRNRR